MKKIKKTSLLIITDDLKYACGVTTYLYNLLLGLVNNRELDIHILCSGGDSIERFQNLKIKVIVKDYLRYELRSAVNFSKSVLFLSGYIIKHKIELIHSQNHYVANIAYYASIFFNVKTIQSHHNYFISHGRLKFYRASKHIAVSERIRSYILKNKFAEEKDVFLVRCGIKYKNALGPKNNQKINILSLSRLVQEKGFDTFIKAVDLIPEKYYQKANFYLAGEGKEEKKITELINSSHIQINFLGKITEPLNLFSKNHIYVMTTYWESEGYPLTMIEAALTNNLIITSDFEGVEEVFENNRDGFIFKHSNPLDLAEKIIYTIDNYNKLDFMINNFSHKINNLFNYQKMIDDTNKIYERCLN